MAIEQRKVEPLHLAYGCVPVGQFAQRHPDVGAFRQEYSAGPAQALPDILQRGQYAFTDEIVRHYL